MRALALMVLVAAPLAAQQPYGTPASPASRPAPATADPDRNVPGGALPAGWTGRTDRGQPLTTAKFEVMEPGYHVSTGPAVILYRAADRAAAGFHTLATFNQTKAPTHPEGFGMFVAGNSLDSDAQSYIYLLVRGDGAYLIKRRVGANVTTIADWTVSPAVAKADAAGKSTNKIEIQSSGGKLTFTINGTQVHEMAATPAETAGIVGLRVNHNLEVHVQGFALHQF
jgi:hypothetical protein